MRRGRSATASLFVLAAVALCGCDQLTRSHYEMIIVNQSTTLDVEKTLGEADYKLPDQWHYERVDDHRNVIIDFNDDGVVTRKQWVEEGEWDDTQKPDDDDTYESTEIRDIDD